MKMKNPLQFFKMFLFGIVALGVMITIGAVRVQASPQQAVSPPMQGQPPSASLTPEQLQQLVAPIALYPDALVAQILAASIYPTQIVEAERFIQQNPGLQGTALGAEVDKQDWDPSVKALTQFPSVLADLDKDLSWTSELGDANSNQQADVMSAVQFMRGKAEAAGNLKSTPQQSVTNQGSDVVIQPVNPDTVYVPDYDPELAYGYPIGLWPGFDPWWDVDDPYLSFGIGYGMSPFFGYGWGWNGWGLDWRHGGLMYGGGRYAFQGRSFYDRNAYFGGNYRGNGSYARGDRGLRGYGAAGDRGNAGMRSSGLGRVSHGGDARGSSSRGRSSMGGGGMRGGGGGGMRGGGGGGMRGGGGGGGGGHR
jgi:hypothetical protein